MLLPMLIHTEAFKVDVPSGPKLWLNGAGDVNGALHVKFLHAALHDAELERNHTRHFNRAAKGDFAIALAEMQVTDAELGA